MKFCGKCGNPVNEGQECGCSATPKPVIAIDTSAAQGFLEAMKNRMGIGDAERNATDTYERGMKIVPECISAKEDEIPVRQYNIAVFRNLFRFERAEISRKNSSRLVFAMSSSSGYFHLSPCSHLWKPSWVSQRIASYAPT